MWSDTMNVIDQIENPAIFLSQRKCGHHCHHHLQWMTAAAVPAFNGRMRKLFIYVTFGKLIQAKREGLNDF